MTSALTVGSLFSGIGGMELGLERAGMRVKWQVEIDPWCRRVLAKHWPDVPKYEDIKDVTELPYVDVIAGGFPCQPISSLGKQLGQDDDRWLWPEFDRIIRMVRPRYILVENVPKLLTDGMSDVLGTLAACGYDAEWQCIPAAAFGAPHPRDRVWIIAYPQGVTEREPNHTVYPIPERRQTWPVSEFRSRWSSEPGVCRVDDGLPVRVDQRRGLGNAVVPQVVEYIGRQIVRHAT